jgi:opacity protein-like surface antigen
MSRKQALVGFALIACFFGSNTQADEPSGPYLGVSVGWATDKADEFEDSGVGFKVFGGYAFNEYFAAELGYVDAGKLEDHIQGLNVTIESSGVIAAVLGRLPLGDAFSLFAKVGYALYDEKVTLRQAAGFMQSETNDADDPLYGVGAELSLGERVQLRAEYEIVDIPDADFDIVTVGATLRF